MSYLSRIYNGDKSNEYYTLEETWDELLPFLNKDFVYWEGFYGNGDSTNILRNKGLTVVGNDFDFFDEETRPEHWDVLLSNPPFDIKKLIMDEMVRLDKPFILLLPLDTLGRVYFKPFRDKCKIIIPAKRPKFKMNDGTVKSCFFECAWFFFKYDIDTDLPKTDLIIL